MLKSSLVSKQKISLVLFFIINLLFGIKYLSRVTAFYPILIILFISAYVFCLEKKEVVISFLKRIKLTLSILIVIYIIFSLVLFYLIPKETLNVDRWSVISSFWDNYFNDEYVYYAKSFDGNYPGPMPFYFILALPFYCIGELGLYSLLGIMLFTYLMQKHTKSKELSTIVFLLIATSLFYIWEISTRSNIFFNGTIVLLSIYFFFKRYKTNLNNDVLFGIIFGLVLSTRNVYVIPLIIAILFALKTQKINFKHLILLGLFTIIAFALTFLPFVWNHLEDFKIMNPFIIQSSFLMPFEYTIAFVLLSFLTVFFCRSESDVYFYSGLVLFLTIIFYFGYTIYVSNFETTFYGSRADISYFILCLPFVLFHCYYAQSEK